LEYPIKSSICFQAIFLLSFKSYNISTSKFLVQSRLVRSLKSINNPYSSTVIFLIQPVANICLVPRLSMYSDWTCWIFLLNYPQSQDYPCILPTLLNLWNMLVGLESLTYKCIVSQFRLNLLNLLVRLSPRQLPVQPNGQLLFVTEFELPHTSSFTTLKHHNSMQEHAISSKFWPVISLYAVKELCKNCSIIANCVVGWSQRIGHVWKPCYLIWSHLWPDLQKDTYPIQWTWRTVTYASKHLQTWNFSHLLTCVGTYYCLNFMAMTVFNLKLWIIKVG